MAIPEPGTRPVLAVDAALGAGFLAALLVERFMLAAAAPRPAAAGVVVGVGLAVAIALRRRFPFGAFVLSAAALCLEVLLTTPSWLAPYANLLGVFSVARYAGRRARRQGGFRRRTGAWLLGAALGFGATPDLAALLTTIVGAAAAGNLALEALAAVAERNVRPPTDAGQDEPLTAPAVPG